MYLYHKDSTLGGMLPLCSVKTAADKSLWQKPLYVPGLARVAVAVQMCINTWQFLSWEELFPQAHWGPCQGSCRNAGQCRKA